jgi:hypothetical protein
VSTLFFLGQAVVAFKGPLQQAKIKSSNYFRKMNSSLVENLDSIRNVVGEITSRIDKINTDYGYDQSLSLNKPSLRISKKKSYIFVTLVVLEPQFKLTSLLLKAVAP